MSFERPLVVDWKGLKRLGWPYGRTHTWRLMFDPDYAGDPFPRARKLGRHRNAHVANRDAERSCPIADVRSQRRRWTMLVSLP